MNIDRSEVKRILVITLSNVGDVVLTTPVVRALDKEFPESRIDVMVGPRAKEIFEKDPRVFKLIIYDKHITISQKRRLQLKLKRLHYDLVVDIRNTIFPLLIGPKYRTGTIQRFPTAILHSKVRHLYRLQSLGINNLAEPAYIHIPEEDRQSAEDILNGLSVRGEFVIINPGAKSHLKRWTLDGFAHVADHIRKECRAEIIFIGQGEDAGVVSEIVSRMKHKPHNIVDKTNICQLAHLLKEPNY